MTTWLHEQRLQAVQAAVRQSGARSVLDLGCGDGDLFLRLAREPAVVRLLGIDICAAALDRLRHSLKGAELRASDIDLRIASFTEHTPALAGFDCALLVETIEHIEPYRLGQLEHAVFHGMRPGTVIVTTPNAEFNPLLGVPSDRFRHPDHRFEWPRARFRQWADRVAARAGYRIACRDIAGCHPDLGGASQMAVFCIGSPDRRNAVGS